MKTQKFLATFPAGSTAADDIELILGYQKQIDELQGKRKTSEQNLAGELIKNFEAHAQYPEFRNILNSTVYEKEEKQGTLLTNICNQLARSLARYYDTPKDTPHGFINWGVESYIISSNKIKEEVASLVDALVQDKIESLNPFLNELGIQIQFRALSLNGNEKNEAPISVGVKIFLDQEEKEWTIADMKFSYLLFLFFINLRLLAEFALRIVGSIRLEVTLAGHP